MKTNGAIWKAYLDSWPDGQWFDDCDESINGVPGSDLDSDMAIADDAVVEFTCGVVYATQTDKEGVSITSHFRAWLKAQTHTTVVCSIPKDSLEAFTAFVKSIKGSVAA